MEQEILDLSYRIKSLFNDVKDVAKSQIGVERPIVGGLLRNGKFYSSEVLKVLIKTVAGTFGRLAYKEDQRKRPRFSTSKFKTIYTDFFCLQYQTEMVADAEQMIAVTVMLEQILTMLKTFEKGGRRNG